jgi:hypothetical protein
MDYKDLHDEFSCVDLTDDLKEANGIVFLLPSSVCLELASAYMRRDQPAALYLLNNLESEIIETLQCYATESRHVAKRADVVVEAVHELSSLLGAGHALSESALGLY